MSKISRKSTLVGIVCLLILCVTTSSYSQANAANNVEGTSWESPKQPIPLGAGMGHLYYLYNFEPNGVMTLEAIAIQNIGLTDGGEIIQPTSGSSPKTRGKYRLDGKSITIDLPDLVINATVYENSIIGESVDKVDSTRKVQWIVTKISAQAISQSSKTETGSSSPVSSKPLSSEIIARYNPTLLSTHTLTGRIDGGNNRKKEYFAFWAGPGEITMTVILTSLATTFDFCNLTFYLTADRDLPIGNGIAFVGGNGETKQVVTKVNLFSKQQLLLAVESSSGRSAKYEIKIGGALGAFDTGKSTRSAGEAAQIAIANSHGEIVIEKNGKYYPAQGYRWVKPDDAHDFRVERILK